MRGGLLALLGDRQVFCEDEARPLDPWIYTVMCVPSPVFGSVSQPWKETIHFLARDSQRTSRSV